MQPTNLQVRRSLEALSTASRSAASSGSTALAPTPMSDADVHLCVEMVAELGDEPVIRPERLEEARQRLEAGSQPTADDLADRMVGRLVCDRLR